MKKITLLEVTMFSAFSTIKKAIHKIKFLNSF